MGKKYKVGDVFNPWEAFGSYSVPVSIMTDPALSPESKLCFAIMQHNYEQYEHQEGQPNYLTTKEISEKTLIPEENVKTAMTLLFNNQLTRITRNGSYY